MKIIKEIFSSNRVKSLVWRASMMWLVALCNLLGENLTGFRLTPDATVIVGLVLSEVSKAINNSLEKK